MSSHHSGTRAPPHCSPRRWLTSEKGRCPFHLGHPSSGHRGGSGSATVAGPAAVAVAAAPGAEAAVEEEKTEFDVVLESFGSEKIQVIKAVRALTGLGLKEAKEKVDGAPSVLLEGAKKEDADKAKADIEAVGGTVTLK